MNPGDITQLIRRIDEGDAQAADEILPLVYNQLRELAAARMAREYAAHTLQPTALVHEAWLRLGGDQQQNWKNRAHFFAAAAEAMRRILIEGARRRAAIRHGGGLEKISANVPEFEVAAPPEVTDDRQLLLLHEALENLAVKNPRQAELVKQWYFVGLTLAEAAETMDISLRTAEREWAFARAWLVNEMKRLRP